MQVKRKSYIKPFEKVLAMLELEAITHTKNVQQTGDDFYKVQTDTTEDVLLHRLAYWESAGEDVLKNTTQSCAMVSMTSMNTGGNFFHN